MTLKEILAARLEKEKEKPSLPATITVLGRRVSYRAHFRDDGTVNLVQGAETSMGSGREIYIETGSVETMVSRLYAVMFGDPSITIAAMQQQISELREELATANECLDANRREVSRLSGEQHVPTTHEECAPPSDGQG